MQLKQSKNKAVAENYVLRSSRKWNIEETVNRAESRLRLDRMVWQGQKDRAGFGLLPRQKPPHSASREHRKWVSKMVAQEEDEKLFIKAIQQGVQGK